MANLTQKTRAQKISETMKKRKIDNFSVWRDNVKKSGLIKSEYKSLVKGEKLAELIGVVLGDGHIEKFPRTERLYIVGNSKNKKFIMRYADIAHDLFGKVPKIKKVKNSNCYRLYFYEKYISKRLGVPTGSREGLEIKVPKWILKNEQYMIAYIRGLYEAEGCFSVHKMTSTYKMFFTN